VFEPQGTAFFLLLIVVFGGLLVWVALARQLVFRVLAACLAFLPAMVFGIAAVNKYYDYYQTWGGMINDLTGQGAGSIPKYAAGGAGTNKHFQKPFRHHKFPVIELLHGAPGDPQAWVDVMAVIPTFLSLLEAHPDDAAVLVMPDTDGGLRYALQCLNNPRGIQDMTFVARDVPEAIARIARVQPPGRAWGVAGYSEGGYCAANIALQDPQGYGAAGVLSGYFAPIPSEVPAGDKPGAKPIRENVFRGYPGLQFINTPRAYITRVPINDLLPVFWLAAGAQDRLDVIAAENFRQLLETRVANVPFMMVPDGGHQGSVWRAALGPMLSWMTPQLARQAAHADAVAARAAARAAAARKAQHAKPRPSPAATMPKK